jgi:hypothetical protein
MLTSLFGRCIGLGTVVCVLLLFFFPLAQGNFQSTHGPVTALRSKRNVLVILFSMMLAALRILAHRIPAFSSCGCKSGFNQWDSRHWANYGRVGVLRC